MAKQANVQGAIDKLRSSNEKILGEMNDRTGEVAFNTRTTKNLIGDMLDGMALDRQRSQDKEEGPAKKEGGSSSSGSDPKKGDGFDLGIGTILAGIGGAITGFVSGFVSAFTRPLKRMLGRFTKMLKTSKLGVFLTNWGKNAAASVRNFFSPLTKLLKNMRLDFTKAFKGNANAAKGFSSFVGQIVGFISKTLKSLGLHPTQLKRRFNAVRRSLGVLRNSINGTTGFFGKIGKTFGKVGDGVKKAGKVMGGLGKAFGTVFRVFSTIGRVIAFPITVITGLFGGIMQMFKDFGKSREEGDGIIKSLFKGFRGFFKGAINAIIMKPLDMLKDGIGWLLGKLGFQNAENALAGFSFSGLFTKVWDWLTDFVINLPGMIVDALVGAVKGIGNFFSNIDFGGFFGGIGDKVGEWWGKASDGFFKKFEHAKDTFGKLKGKVAGLQDKFRQFIMDKLPEKGSFLEKFVPDAVYEWVGQTGRFAPPEQKDAAVDEPAKKVEEGEMTKAELEQQLKADEADLAAAQKALDDGTGSELEVEKMQMFVDATKMQLEGLKELTKTNEDMNKARMESIKTGDDTKLKALKEERTKTFEERETEKLAKMKKDLKLAEEGKLKLGWTWTDAEIAAEKDEIFKKSMIDDNSAEAQVREREKLKEDIARKEKEIADFKLQQAQREADIQKFGSVEAGKLARMSEADREKNLTRAREMIAKSERGEEVMLRNKQRAEALLAAESQRQQAMVVAPSTQVVNNNSSQGIVMNQNMPAVDNLDTTYG
jgi:hypothetical protein